MNINELQRRGSQDTCILDNSLRKKGRLWYRRSLKESDDKRRQTSGTLPRGWKQTKQCKSNSLIDYSDPQRTSVVLEKQDNDTYGFEIQTYGLQQKSSASSVALEMCTFVCKVQENSAAETAGLTTGDVIISVNGASIEGLSHQHIVDLIRDSTNLLKMETICGTVVKRIELEKKMSLLKQMLREKRLELQALTLQEKRLMRGNLNGSSLHPSLESQVSLDSLTSHGQRFSSDSSYRSVMTEDSDQASSVFGDLSSPSSYSTVGTTDDSLFFSTDFPNQESPGGQIIFSPIGPHRILGRSRTHGSSLAGSSSSLSTPSWDETRASTLFGTLPRKNRRGSVRKHILKLIPGFNRSVEEEERRPNEMEIK